MKHNILLVDNDPVFIGTCAEYLEPAGYKIFSAGSPAEARLKLDSLWLHLAIVDVRLTNDDDPNDKSGLQLALDMACVIPTLILTRYRDEDERYKTLRYREDGKQRIMDYIDKRKELPELLQAIQNILKLEQKLNPRLKIEWNACDRFGLISSIELDLDPNFLANRLEELEDLFRQLFKQESIRLQCRLWTRLGRIALAVFAFDDISAPESFLVTCGKKAAIEAEASMFDTFSPKGNSQAGTALINRTHTLHYAANVYSLDNNDLENVFNLAELYRRETEKTFNIALDGLFNHRLLAWHQNKRLLLKRAAPGDILARARQSLLDVDFAARASVIEDLTPTIGLKIKRETGRLLVKPGSLSYNYPDPLPAILKLAGGEPSHLAIKAPGTISGESVLVDANGQVWLTDFAEAGLAPPGWNYASLETAIRFDWLDIPDLHHRFDMEASLQRSDFTIPDARDLDAACRKAVHAIGSVRKLYSQLPNNDIPGYQRLVFLQATLRLARFDPASPLTSSEIARMGQILLALAMIASELEQMDASAGEPISTHLKLKDKTARIFMVGDRQVDVPVQPFNLLIYLYEHPGRVCAREELFENVLKCMNYEAGYLDTLVGRVRDALGEDAKHSRYLFTIRNVGFRLVLEP